VYHCGDFLRIEEESRLFEGVTTIIHLIHTTIPSTSMQDMVYDVASNVIPSLRLLEQARQWGVSRFLFISSGGTVYGAPQRIPVSEEDPTLPLCSYGITKLAIEKYVQLYTRFHGIRGVVIRLSNPYGRHQLGGVPVGAIANFLNKVKKGQPIEIWGDGSIVRDYIYIDDVVEAIERIVTHHTLAAGVYNLGSGQGYSLNEVLTEICRVTKISPEVSYLPSRPFDVPKIVLNVERIKRALQWEPRVSLREGITRMWSYLGRDRQPSAG
jgi:UDP-glucose 4-epimerase